MAISEQQATIHTTDFYNNVRAKLQAVNALLQENGIAIEGSLVVTVDDVKLRMLAPTGDGNVQLEVGDGNGEPLYTWRIPIAWVS
jgi:DUF971 family protein